MKKSTSILRGLNDIRASYILESEIPDAAPAASDLSDENSARGVWRRITSSGWFAAAVCAIVAGGVLTGIILAGQNGPGTVTPPAGTVAPPPIIETTPIEEETSEPIAPYTEGLEYTELTPDMVLVAGIGSATDATVIHVPPKNEQGLDIVGIAEGAFAGNTSITEVVLSADSSRGFFNVAASAFEGCTSLRRVRVCPTDTKIYFRDNSFKNCVRLSEMDVPPDSHIYPSSTSMDGTLWLESQTDDFVILSGSLLKYQGSGTEILLPDSVRQIIPDAFQGCHTVTSVTATDHSLLTSLGYRAFAGADSLKNVYLPNLEVLEGTAFNDCPALETVYLPSSITGLLPEPPESAAVFLYAGTREAWEQITFYSEDSKAAWEAVVIFEQES